MTNIRIPVVSFSGFQMTFSQAVSQPTPRTPFTSLLILTHSHTQQYAVWYLYARNLYSVDIRIKSRHESSWEFSWFY
jgi:hypothetical protein